MLLPPTRAQIFRILKAWGLDKYLGIKNEAFIFIVGVEFHQPDLSNLSMNNFHYCTTLAVSSVITPIMPRNLNKTPTFVRKFPKLASSQQPR